MSRLGSWECRGADAALARGQWLQREKAASLADRRQLSITGRATVNRMLGFKHHSAWQRSSGTREWNPVCVDHQATAAQGATGGRVLILPVCAV
jgi:hypothetical protein